MLTCLYRRLRQPRRLLLALTGLALLALALLIAINGYLTYRRALSSATLRLSADLEVLTEQTESMLGAAEVLLSELQRAARQDGLLHAAGCTRYCEALRLAVAGLPQLRGVHLVDHEGRVVFSTSGNAGRRRVADREYFRVHRDGQARFLGPAVLGRLSGESVVPMSIRLHGDAGEFAGVAVASLSLRHIEASYDRLSEQFDLQIGMLLRDGRVIAAASKLKAAPQRVDAARLEARVGGQPQGQFRARSPADGREKVFVFRNLPKWPVVLILGLDHGRLLQSLYPQFARGALVWVLFAVVTVLGVRRLLQQMAQLEQGRAELQQAYQTMKTMAGTDELTGLPNRRQFKELARQELRHGRRDGYAAALMLFDIDRFKQVNDQFGHDVGDAALVAVAQVMQRTLRECDVRCRWGGEEFAVLFVNADPAQAVEAAQRLREAVAAHDVVTQAVTLRVTLSGGLAGWACPEEDLDGLVKRADDALYRAKAGGRNRICTSMDLPPPAATSAKVEADLPMA